MPPPNPSLLAAVKREQARRAGLVLKREAAEDDLVEFIKLMWHAVEPEAPFVSGWPLEAMADFLMAVTDGHIKRGLINIFPGAMKSLMLNVFWPAWEMGPKKLAHLRYISTSYSSALTERDNARFLRVLQSPLYKTLWPHVVVAKEGVGEVSTTKTGWKVATSVGGKMTGMRGDRILIDDANNPADVESSQVRGQTVLWLREVMPDRLNNLAEGVIISIQQRTHEEDATGTLAEYGTDYTWLCIPMEFDPLRFLPTVLRRDEDGEPSDVWLDPRGLDDDGNQLEGLYTDPKGVLRLREGSPMAKAEGALAWPDRFAREQVEEQRRIKGPYGFSGQYQQLPTARGGSIVQRDWWNSWTRPTFPDFGTVVASLDTALEQSDESDYNALVAFGAFPSENGSPQLMLRLGERKRCSLAELVKWTYDHCVRVKADYLLIEHKTRGRDVYDEIRRLYQSAPFETILLKVNGDKVSRLNAVSHLFSGDVRVDAVSGISIYENGMIWAPETSWADDVINEVASFPRGAHDDLVDAVSQALGWIRKNNITLRRVEYEADRLDAMKFRRAPGVPYTIGR